MAGLRPGCTKVKRVEKGSLVLQCSAIRVRAGELVRLLVSPLVLWPMPCCVLCLVLPLQGAPGRCIHLSTTVRKETLSRFFCNWGRSSAQSSAGSCLLTPCTDKSCGFRSKQAAARFNSSQQQVCPACAHASVRERWLQWTCGPLVDLIGQVR